MVPLRGRLARAVSLAGSWAMRPQTAMAAVFLVMIGTSVLLLRGKSSRAPASAEMTVTEEGTPAPAAASAAPPADQPATVAAAEPAQAAAPRPMPAYAAAPAPTADMLDDERARAPGKSAMAKSEDKDSNGTGALALNAPARRSMGAAGAPAGPMPASPPPSPAPAAAGGMAGPSFATAPEAEMAPATQPAIVADPSDELWAARTARDAAARQGRPCPSGPRFDDVASRAPGSQPGWDALYEGALCYESLGEFGSARTRLGTLLGVPSYRDRARATLDRINKEQQGGSSAARAAAPKAAPAAPAAAAAPPPVASPPADGTR